ncbi:MAG: HPr family phosphocarrier protein [Solidesulfovibrio sp. DCME]|uniref:HPr family phosphocarrier protein n=1 Tax=Solidesulfovibrio sp. DCME TaxID=3447380 RepID=UPI003D13F650
MSNETNDADEAALEGLAVGEDGLALRVRVLNDQGLHARPAARLAQEAQKFGCDISLALGGEVVDAKSILDILTLAAGQGSELELRASGPEARDALTHLGSLIRNRFR